LPAEYGRRLGGVIALDTRRTALRGHHTEIDLQRGSFDSSFGSLTQQYSNQRTAVSLGVQGGSTDRYLDPPSLENYTNRGNSSGRHGRLFKTSATGTASRSISVRITPAPRPNDLLQQARTAAGSPLSETGPSTTNTVSARALASVRGISRPHQ
jgi:hypothetical protein